MPVESALATARDTRPDVLAVRKGTEAARQQVVAALGQWYPSVSLELEYFLHKESVPTANLWEGFIDVNLPLFDAGIIYANVLRRMVATSRCPAYRGDDGQAGGSTGANRV